MIIGVPKEIKNNENRVALTPAGVAEFKKHGHVIYVQASAGENSGFNDSAYTNAGAIILPTIEAVYEIAEMIVEEIQQSGGIMTVEDLKNYNSVWRDPIKFKYKDLEIS